MEDGSTGSRQDDGYGDAAGSYAVVDIEYDAKTYWIEYKDSTNLDYTGSSIHKNYIGWIENLDKAIRAQLTTS